ncbi:hypothetical protein [Acidaminococcus fermentans]|uniref:hypothetical protein n=1 Tax=Acidaminococcus fermentans TaxID=905 RepID=UPI00242F9468|nr:hypothetical protein [Acidaminococcus fermentans]
MNGAFWQRRQCGACEAAMDRRVIANVILGFGCIALLQEEFFLGAGLIALSCVVRKQ